MKVIMPLAILGVIVVGGAALFMNASPNTDSDSSEQSAGSNSIAQEQHASVGTPTASAQPATASVDNSGAAPTSGDRWDTVAGLEAVKSWKASRGYFDQADLQTYRNYSAETLQKLADSGDIKAIHEVGNTQLLAVADKKDVIATYFEAAVLGSSYALDLAGSTARTNRDYSRFDGPDGDQLFKNEMLESLSIYQVALLRGDRGVTDQIKETRAQLTLTLEDDKYIEKRGGEIYRELEAKRIAMGLGAFDNSVPPVVDDFFDAEQTRVVNK